MALIESITQSGAVPVIPPRANRRDSRTYDVHLYKERHLVECFINKMKQYRRISSRFDKLAVYGISDRCHNYLGTMKCQQNLVKCGIFSTKLTMSMNVCYELWESVECIS